MPIWHCRHGLDNAILSCLCRRYELNWRQVKTVFSSPQYIWDWTVANWKMGRGIMSRWGKTVLSCRQFSTHCRHGQDETRQLCLCRQCEIGVYCYYLSLLPLWWIKMNIKDRKNSHWVCEVSSIGGLRPYSIITVTLLTFPGKCSVLETIAFKVLHSYGLYRNPFSTLRTQIFTW